jgi:hypothetical protein
MRPNSDSLTSAPAVSGDCHSQQHTGHGPPARAAISNSAGLSVTGNNTTAGHNGRTTHPSYQHQLSQLSRTQPVPLSNRQPKPRPGTTAVSHTQSLPHGRVLLAPVELGRRFNVRGMPGVAPPRCSPAQIGPRLRRRLAPNCGGVSRYGNDVDWLEPRNIPLLSKGERDIGQLDTRTIFPSYLVR